MRNKRMLSVLFAVLSSLLLAGMLAGTALALLGDLNIDGPVDAADMDIISAAYGSHEGSSNWGGRLGQTELRTRIWR